MVSIDAVLASAAANTDNTTVSNALSSEISATNSDVVSLDAYIDGVSGDLATEIANTNSDVVSLDGYIDSVSGDLATEIANTNSDVVSIDAAIAAEIANTNSDVVSLEGVFDGFAKEAFIHGIVSGIVGTGGGGGTLLAVTGNTVPAGSVGNWAEATNVITLDLNDAIEGNNAAEHQQNFVSCTVNGLEVGATFFRFTNSTTVEIDTSSLFSGGALMEADDVLEFKYIKN